MPCWITFQIWQTRIACPCGISLSAFSWYYIFFTPLQVCKKMCCFTALTGGKKGYLNFENLFLFVLFPNSYTDTSLYFFHSIMQNLIFFPSISLRLGGIWVRFLRMLDQKATASLPTAADNQINQAETKGSCLFWEDNINGLLCTMESLVWGRIPGRASLEQPDCSVPSLVSEGTTEPQVTQFRFTVHYPWRYGAQHWDSKPVLWDSKSSLLT